MSTASRVPRRIAGPGRRAVVLVTVLCAALAGCSALSARPPVSRSEAIGIAASEYDTTSSNCGFSSCPSISPRPLVVESARIEPGRRHADACPTEALTRDTTVRVWAVVMRFAADPGTGRIWLIDERSGEILCSSEYDAAYRSLVHE